MANELEFQGDVLKWMDREINRRPGLGITDVGQEKQYVGQRRSDLVIWLVRDRDALAACELKTVATGMNDAAFQDDVIKKARKVRAPYCVQWNQRSTRICATPPAPPNADALVETFDRSDVVFEFSDLAEVATKDYVGGTRATSALRRRAGELLGALANIRDTGAVGGRIVDPSVFVAVLAERVKEIRRHVAVGVRARAASSAKLRRQLNAWAQRQGPQVGAGVLYERAAAQLVYRVVGQVVFYLAYAGYSRGLPAFRIDPEADLRQQLDPLWKAIRSIDYEALYEADEVLDQLPLSALAEGQLKELLAWLDDFEWSSLSEDVLGAVFENLIPVGERDLLGQYYTPPHLAELIVAFCVDGSTEHILDPACGTGEFLVQSYRRLGTAVPAPKHGERLEAIWGTDISHFPTELAVINLCRQDFSEPNNFPRVLTKDFFELHAGAVEAFPPSRAGQGQKKVPVTVPEYQAIVGNPPYLRWQKLDDLDATYRGRLAKVWTAARVGRVKLTDIYVLFFIHALNLLKPGGRLGFVTSNAWLRTEYGVGLQLYLLRKAQIVAIVGSEAEPFFPQAAINTVVTVVEKPEKSLARSADYPLRFVSLKERLSAIVAAAGGDTWAALDQLVARIENASEPIDDQTLRLRLGSRTKELEALAQHRVTRPWNLPMRAPSLLLEVLPTDYRHA